MTDKPGVCSRSTKAVLFAGDSSRPELNKIVNVRIRIQKEFVLDFDTSIPGWHSFPLPTPYPHPNFPLSLLSSPFYLCFLSLFPPIFIPIFFNFNQFRLSYQSEFKFFSTDFWTQFNERKQQTFLTCCFRAFFTPPTLSSWFLLF